MVEMDVRPHRSLPKLRAGCGKNPTNSSILCAMRREMQLQGHKFWQEEVDRVGKSVGK